MRKVLRFGAYVLSALLVLIGVTTFVHDGLVLLHVIAPFGDGPFGIIVGSVLAAVGGVWIGYLRATRSVLNS